MFATGAALMNLNSAFGIGIGVLMVPILRVHNNVLRRGQPAGAVQRVAGAALFAAMLGKSFELTFAIWLIARGFAATATVRSRAST